MVVVWPCEEEECTEDEGVSRCSAALRLEGPAVGPEEEVGLDTAMPPSPFPVAPATRAPAEAEAVDGPPE